MNKYLKYTLSILTLSLVVFTSCLDGDDLMTDGVNTGGYIEATGSVPYKLGSTPSFDVTIDIPKGPGIVSLKVLKTFTHNALEETSGEVLMSTMDISSGNVNENLSSKLTLTYSDLKAGISIPGYELPDDELLLNIGDYWTFQYVAVMEDGREVVNNSKTTVGVANFFAGKYDAAITYWHPTAGGGPDTNVDEPYIETTETKDLVAIDAKTCKTWFARWTDAYIYITIEDDNSISITTENWDYDVSLGDSYQPDLESRYDPETGTIYLYYKYMGSGGYRTFHEIFTPAQ
ncbi:DUF4361 domain-containing protein [Carboxylicivirga mesophila]|uniref:DUF4361 domain-containing protein n=1 Tax=Carboxylicivirga mesophila TaxID=1166478 RepID=A0ABS5K7D1_9BACT|nr:DUF4361 domain-containing protein [Carboxylicivirga mesophila]MBS2210899.1 DUF4361 domain-containing protein [Carboxylicivirga mesophila]